jgi:hypothetical protein
VRLYLVLGQLFHATGRRVGRVFYILFYLNGNTEIVSQTALDHNELSNNGADSYLALLRGNRLSMRLLSDAANPNLREVHMGWPEHISHFVTKPNAALSNRQDGTIC